MKVFSSYLYGLKFDRNAISTSKYRGQALSPREFSKFKHGDGFIAKKYGFSLYQLFMDHYAKVLLEDPKRFVLVSPVNKGITPTIKFFQLFINSHLFKLEKPPITRIEMKFVGSGTTRNDYASLPKKDRGKILGDGMFVTDQNFLRGKRIIVIDDLRASGVYENTIKKTLKVAGAECAIFLYLIQVPREVTEERQDIESILDHSYVNNLPRLRRIMLADYFILNQRVCKFLLTQKDLKTFRGFLKKLPDDVIHNIYMLSINEGYGLINTYKKGFSVLEGSFIRKFGHSFPTIQ